MTEENTEETNVATPAATDEVAAEETTDTPEAEGTEGETKEETPETPEAAA
jgi:hypothetical protein